MFPPDHPWETDSDASEPPAVSHARRFFSSSRRRPEALAAPNTPVSNAPHSEDASWMVLRPIDAHLAPPSEPPNGGARRSPHPPLRRGTIRAPESVLPLDMRHENEAGSDHSPGEGGMDEHLNHENALHLLEMVADRRNSAQFI